MKRSLYFAFALIAFILISGCSTKRNTRTTRLYHAINARYNIYYNGKISFDNALESFRKGYKENYTEQIQLYPISSLPKDKPDLGGPFDRAIEKGNKAIKMHTISAKPKKKRGWRQDPEQVRLQMQKEYNPFLKNCWLLIGEGQFYNGDFLAAAATFTFITRQYATNPEMISTAKLWQARCYSEMDWLYESENILHQLNQDGIPKKKLNQYAAVYADFLIKTDSIEASIPYLQTAIKAEKNHLQRTRMRYLLGQLYMRLELNHLAYKTFGKVVHANPPYPLEFAARIRQTEVFVGTNNQKVIKQLNRMAKSQKNKELLDQVYYALGNVYLAEEDTTQAIQQYKLGIEKSVQMGMDKAICQIRLGDLYFQQRDYIHAQPCFSGALAGIDKNYKDYKRVAHLSAILDELVVHAEAVHLQDSLQFVAKMPEKERLARIDSLIAEVKQKEKEEAEASEQAQYLAEQEAQGNGIQQPTTKAPTMVTTPSIGGASFYFYNAQTVTLGKQQFQRKWGRRVLEDNWRRRKKKMSTFDFTGGNATGNTTEQTAAQTADLAQNSDSLATDLPADLSDDPHQRPYYLQQLPFTAEEVAASNVIIIDALYHMAMIYKDKLEDLPLAIKAFEELEKRFPGHEHLLESEYQVYLMTCYRKDEILANKYKQKIITDFPESAYAKAIINPNYLYNVQHIDAIQDSIYQLTYRHYLASDTTYVRQQCDQVSTNYPLATLLPKFMFLRALTFVQAGDVTAFKLALKDVLDKYPQAEVAQLAGDMLKGVLQGRTMVKGNVSGMKWNLRFGTKEDGSISAIDSTRTFTTELHEPYRLLMIYPNGQIDENQLVFSVAAFNFTHFLVKTFDITLQEAGDMRMVNLSGFFNFKEIVQYYKMIHESEDGYGRTLDKHVALLPISDSNYNTLMQGKTLPEYVRFFADSLGQQLPGVLRQWEQLMTLEKQRASLPKDTVKPLKQDSLPKDTIIPVTQATLPKDTIISVKNKLKFDSLKVEGPERTFPAERIAPRTENGLKLEEIQAIKERQAKEDEVHKEEARKAFEKEQEDQKAQQEKIQLEKAKLIEQQKAEEAALLKQKQQEEKRLTEDKKTREKRIKAERKAKLKARNQLLKEKERAYKLRRKQKEKERKAKEKEYKRKRKAKEAEYKKHRKELEEKAKKERK